MSDAEAERRSAVGDLVAGGVLFTVSAVGTWSLSTNKYIVGIDYGNDPGPGLLPGLLIGLLALSSIFMMVNAGFKLRARRGAESEPESSRTVGRTLLVPAMMVVALLLYVQSMTWLGFLETTAVFSIFWTVAIGIQDSERPNARSFAIWLAEGVAICAGVYAVFAWFIKVPLP